MDYIYNVEVTAFTGYFTRKEVGKASFKEVRFSNPVQKGDWINVNVEGYLDRLGLPGGVGAGKVKLVQHNGAMSNGIENYSTIYVEFRTQSEFLADLHFAELQRLEKIIASESNPPFELA